MKKLLLALSVALASTLHAQSAFQVTELSNGAPYQSHYVFTTDTSNSAAPTFLLEFKIQNVSSSSKLIKIRKTFLSVSTNTLTGLQHDMYFCYNQTCFGPPTHYWFANIPAGGSLPSGGGSYGLRTEMDHNKVVGTSAVRYTIYDSTNVTDSVNITITYNITAVNEIKKQNHAASFSAWPNPASNVLNFSYDQELGGSAQIKVYNSVGNLVKNVNLVGGTKNTQVDISSLEEGFYFYSLISDGKAVTTRRLVVTR